MDPKATKNKILSIASTLCQAVGFNAFSYHTIAKELKIKTASIHYHYPTKSDLGVALISEYQKNFLVQINNIEESHLSAKARLTALVRLMSELEKNQKLCLCQTISRQQPVPQPNL